MDRMGGRHQALWGPSQQNLPDPESLGSNRPARGRTLSCSVHPHPPHRSSPACDVVRTRRSPWSWTPGRAEPDPTRAQRTVAHKRVCVSPARLVVGEASLHPFGGLDRAQIARLPLSLSVRLPEPAVSTRDPAVNGQPGPACGRQRMPDTWLWCAHRRDPGGHVLCNHCNYLLRVQDQSPKD